MVFTPVGRNAIDDPNCDHDPPPYANTRPVSPERTATLVPSLDTSMDIVVPVVEISEPSCDQDPDAKL